MMRAAAVVFWKELRDALRDRRTLAVVLLSSVAIGPLVLALLSVLVAGAEERAQSRELLVVNATAAPGLVNFVERQGWRVKPPPADWEVQLGASRLGAPVLVVPAGFDATLARGELARLEIVASAADRRSQEGLRRVQALLDGHAREQVTLRLALRGVAPSLAQPFETGTRDLADPAARGAQLTALVPLFVLMAVVYGAMTAALDTTAGERERGSLEPLLTAPVSPLALVLGKWGAVTAVALLIATLSAFSFLPAQALMASESLAALFRYGAGEALAFVALLAPLAGAIAALLMAIAIRAKTVREAQASAAIVVLAVSLMPLATQLNTGGEAAWHRWVPGMAQLGAMGRVLRGEALAWAAVAPGVLVAAAITALGLALVARALRRAALA